MGGQVGKGKKRKAGNPGVGVDFKKVKHKVGKKLPKAQNDTDTNFKARTINLPSQAVKEDKTAATNFQNLTLKELLGQTSHYSDKMRQSALSGLGDLFNRHPEELTGHVGLVWTKLVERIADPEESVRGSLQTLLRDTVCRRVTAGQIRPFLPMIMAHVSGATTHLSLDIRSDALKFLDILMDFYPQLVAAGFLLPCLSHFCDLLSSSHRSRSIKGQSLKSLLTVLKALTDFLRRAFPVQPSTATGPQPPGPSITARRSDLPLCHFRCSWPVRHADSHSAPTHTASAQSKPGQSSGSTGTNGGAGPKGAAAITKQDVAQRLLVLLMECWPECAPATLSITPTLDQAAALVHILIASRYLLDHVLLVQDTAQDNTAGAPQQLQTVPDSVCQALLKALTPHFPATMPAVRPPAPVLEQLVQYNLGCAQVLARLLPGCTQVPGADSTVLAQLPDWALSLMGFYEGVLRTGQVVPAGDVMSQAQQLRPGDLAGSGGAGAGDSKSSTGAHQSVLTGVMDCVPYLPTEVVGRLVAAVDVLASASTARSSLRAACLRLQHRLMTQWQRGELYLEPSWVAQWLSTLPRLLWELGTTATASSSLALSMLHDAARFCPSNPDTTDPQAQPSPLQAALQQLQPQLAPLWAVQLPGKKSKADQAVQGSSAEAVGKVVSGPVPQLPEALQVTAIDTLYHLGALHPTLLSAVLRTVHHGLLPLGNTLRLVEVCMHTAALSTPSVAASTMYTLLFAPLPATAAAADSKQLVPAGGSGSDSQRSGVASLQRQVSNTVLQRLQSMAPASVLLQLLASQLQPLLQQPSASRPAHQLSNGVQLCVLALEEHAAGQQGALPLPAWLDTALPDLLVRCCITDSTARWGKDAGSSVITQLCTAQPGMALRILHAATRFVDALRSGGTGSEDPASLLVEYSAVLSLVQGLLGCPPAKRALLQHRQEAQHALQGLLSQEGLPAQVSSDMTCVAAAQQVRYTAEELLGVPRS